MSWRGCFWLNSSIGRARLRALSPTTRRFRSQRAGGRLSNVLEGLEIIVNRLSGTRLVEDYYAGSPQLSSFYAGYPWSLDAFARRAEQVKRASSKERAALMLSAVQATSPAAVD